jgi:micrococcal nuclease
MAKIIPRLCLLFFLLPSLVLGQGSQTYTVKRVVDGDTLLLSNGDRVRLVGVDTPEIHPSRKLTNDSRRSGKDVETIKKLGRKASDFVKQLIEHEEVTLQFDPASVSTNYRDHYGRLLAYVYFKPKKYEKLPPWLSQDVYYSELYKQGFLNGLIIYAGYSPAYTNYPFEHMDQFRNYAKKAREANRGLWKGNSKIGP